ncbi:MAG: hypothetical protein J0I06_09465 [Planctomycetes bacterium]|nr:hypothetical protein [Planctomycetota bacterium]
MVKRVYEVDDGEPGCGTILGAAVLIPILALLVVCGGIVLAIMRGCGLKVDPVVAPINKIEDEKGKGKNSGGKGDGKDGGAPQVFSDTVDMEDITFKLIEKGWEANKLVFRFTATNHKADRKIRIPGASLVDDTGESHNSAFGVQGGNRGRGGIDSFLIPYDVPTRFALEFDSVVPTVKTIPALQVKVASAYPKSFEVAVKFHKVPLGGRSAPDPVPPVGASETGQVLVKGTTLAAGVEAYLEVDGKREKDWPATASEVGLSVSAGRHKIALRTRRKVAKGYEYYKLEFIVDVTAGGKESVTIGSVVPDPEGPKKW